MFSNVTASSNFTWFWHLRVVSIYTESVWHIPLLPSTEQSPMQLDFPEESLDTEKIFS